MAFKKESGIYAVICLINNKAYIGQSIRLRERLYHQKYYLNKNLSHHRLLQEDWNKYGEEKFLFKVLEITDDLDNKERYWIDKYKSFGNGFNCTTGGIYNNKQDELQKQKRSESFKGEKNPMYGRVGETNPNSRLKEKQVIEIKKRIKNNVPDKEIVKDFNLTKNQFQKIKHNRSWQYLTV